MPWIRWAHCSQTSPRRRREAVNCRQNARSVGCDERVLPGGAKGVELRGFEPVRSTAPMALPASSGAFDQFRCGSSRADFCRCVDEHGVDLPALRPRCVRGVVGPGKLHRSGHVGRVPVAGGITDVEGALA
jgi:hypothetical protein